VSLRLLLKDDARQTAAAEAFALQEISPANPGFVNIIVLAEVSWVLEQQLRLSREDIVDAMLRLLAIEQLTVQHADEVEEALDHYQNSSVGLADLMMVIINRTCGCSMTMTFDRRLAGTGLARLLETQE
jgi:predicted nucleic-acid-binding protein